MTYVIRTWGLLALIVLAGLFATTSCHKTKDDPTPTGPITGAIEGSISPAGAIATVTATSPGGLTFLATPNAATGAFSLPNLAPDSYTLSFTAAAGYLEPATRKISVLAGPATVAGTVVATSDGRIKSGTMSWIADGVSYSTTVLSGQVDGAASTLSLTGEAVSGAKRDQLSLTLYRSFGGNGTYQLGGTYEIGQLRRLDGGIQTGKFVADGSGTLIITSYSVANGTISGSFGFAGTDVVAYPARYVTVTNGTFTVRF
ncbi:hypothetical protein [Hymenobacter algoricola]|uniref:Carboxypeptidase regulatory-like domain-containing protein n=1 Tax=Hymenobacter algoricola TaxID=486267 RepID=A0ABP7NN65_9BACT